MQKPRIHNRVNSIIFQHLGKPKCMNLERH